MPLSRRELMQIIGAAGLASTLPAAAGQQRRVKAIAFDAFTIFDPKPVADVAESTFPGKGGELMKNWRARLFDYQWLRVIVGRYADFEQVARESFTNVAASLHLNPSAGQRDEVVRAFSRLPAWPDVPPALRVLKQRGVRLVPLSNFTGAMLESNIHRAGLDGLFEQVLSTDRVKSFKPAPAAYQIGVDALGLAKEEIVFAAFAGWDAVGAKSYGYPTFWVNRAAAAAEEMGLSPDATGRDLADLASFVLERT